MAFASGDCSDFSSALKDSLRERRFQTYTLANTRQGQLTSELNEVKTELEVLKRERLVIDDLAKETQDVLELEIYTLRQRELNGQISLQMAQSRLASRQADLATSQAEVARLESEFAQHSGKSAEEIQEAMAKIEELKGNQATLESRIASANSQLDSQRLAFQAEKDALAREVMSLNAKLDETSTVLESTRADLASTEQRLLLANQKTATITGQLDEAKIAVNQLEEQLVAANRTSDLDQQRILSLELENARSLQNLKEAEVQASRTTEQLLAAREDILAFRLKNEELLQLQRESQVRDMQAAVQSGEERAALLLEVERLNKVRGEQSAELIALSDRAATAEEQVRSYADIVAQNNSEITNLQQANRAAQQKLREANIALETTGETLTRTQDELLAARNEVANVEEQLVQSTAAHRASTQSLADVQAELVTLQDEMAAATQSNNLAQQEILSLKLENAKALEQLRISEVETARQLQESQQIILTSRKESESLRQMQAELASKQQLALAASDQQKQELAGQISLLVRQIDQQSVTSLHRLEQSRAAEDQIRSLNEIISNHADEMANAQRANQEELQAVIARHEQETLRLQADLDAARNPTVNPETPPSSTTSRALVVIDDTPPVVQSTGRELALIDDTPPVVQNTGRELTVIDETPTPSRGPSTALVVREQTGSQALTLTNTTAVVSRLRPTPLSTTIGAISAAVGLGYFNNWFSNDSNTSGGETTTAPAPGDETTVVDTSTPPSEPEGPIIQVTNRVSDDVNKKITFTLEIIGVTSEEKEKGSWTIACPVEGDPLCQPGPIENTSEEGDFAVIEQEMGANNGYEIVATWTPEGGEAIMKSLEVPQVESPEESDPTEETSPRIHLISDKTDREKNIKSFVLTIKGIPADETTTGSWSIRCLESEHKETPCDAGAIEELDPTEAGRESVQVDQAMTGAGGYRFTVIWTPESGEPVERRLRVPKRICRNLSPAEMYSCQTGQDFTPPQYVDPASHQFNYSPYTPIPMAAPFQMTTGGFR